VAEAAQRKDRGVVLLLRDGASGRMGYLTVLFQ
jgi:hypothetical protein